jgi:hypothetical protein
LSTSESLTLVFVQLLREPLIQILVAILLCWRGTDTHCCGNNTGPGDDNSTLSDVSIPSGYVLAGGATLPSPGGPTCHTLHVA